MEDNKMVEKITEIQELLNNAYTEYLAKTKRRRASDNDFARWLGVSSSNLNQWINGNRAPGIMNAVRLSGKLGPVVFDVLGFPRMVNTAHDPILRFINDNWHLVDDETKEQIHEHIKEIVDDYGKHKSTGGITT
jgi:hypothetical protein